MAQPGHPPLARTERETASCLRLKGTMAAFANCHTLGGRQRWTNRTVNARSPSKGLSGRQGVRTHCGYRISREKRCRPEPWSRENIRFVGLDFDDVRGRSRQIAPPTRRGRTVRPSFRRARNAGQTGAAGLILQRGRLDQRRTRSTIELSAFRRRRDLARPHCLSRITGAAG